MSMEQKPSKTTPWNQPLPVFPAIMIIIFVALGFSTWVRNEIIKTNDALVAAPISALSNMTQGTVTLSSPNGGEIWAPGSTRAITWEFTGNPANIKIDLFKGSKISRTIIRSTPADTGIYYWNVPSGQAIGDEYKIVISSAGNPTITDSSDLSFAINHNTGAESAVDYIIDTPGTVIRDITITVSGGVIIAADDVTLQNVSIICTGDAPNQDGIRAIGVDNLKIRLASIRGCGRHGIYLKNSSGHDIAEGIIAHVGKEAVMFDNINNSWLIGWELHAGVALTHGSHDNRIISTIVRGNGQGKNTSPYPYYISADSYSNQIARSRTRDNNQKAKTVLSENPDNLWYQNVCNEVEGYAGCFFRDPKELDANYGDPNMFSPRIWSICTEATTGTRFSCDFKSYAKANEDPRVKAGDVLIIDSKTGPANVAPSITITKPLWLIGNLMGQKGEYACEVNIGDGSTATGISVASTGVRLENIQIDPTVSMRPDTQLVNVSIKNNKNKWNLVGTEKAIVPRLTPPGC